LLFVVGCDRQTTGKWYRVIESDGKPVLKGWSPSAEIEHTVTGDAAGTGFAVGIAESTNTIPADSAFQASDLSGERIVVYRAENGERLFAVSISSPAPTVQPFALSPDGNSLAVLRGDQIAFYKVPTANGR
jgi:hypothetical protein